MASTPISEATASPSTGATPATTPSTSATPSVAPPVRLLVDTDVAPDDLVALSFLASSPNVTLDAITVTGTGEAHCPRGAEIVLALLERIDAPDIPVACGSSEPISLGHTFPDAFRRNADAAAGLDLPETTRAMSNLSAVELIEATAADADGELRILTLGPLTNMAEALADDPELASKLESVYVMGGAVDVPGNLVGSPDAPPGNTSAEWNIYADPAAAQAVLDSGVEARFVSLDGTNLVPVTATLIDRAGSGESDGALSVLGELFAKNSYMADQSYYLWDAVAAVAAAGYPVVDFTDASLSVDVSEGPTSGATVKGGGETNASYMTEANATAIEDLLVSVMGGK